ncbi:hypothetical protein JOD20_000699 [Herpetosiphon giganteus]|nr:hypothetical protein [Herpetosiphon giganteus]
MCPQNAAERPDQGRQHPRMEEDNGSRGHDRPSACTNAVAYRASGSWFVSYAIIGHLVVSVIRKTLRLA